MIRLSTSFLIIVMFWLLAGAIVVDLTCGEYGTPDFNQARLELIADLTQLLILVSWIVALERAIRKLE